MIPGFGEIPPKGLVVELRLAKAKDINQAGQVLKRSLEEDQGRVPDYISKCYAKSPMQLGCAFVHGYSYGSHVAWSSFPSM